MEREIWEGLFGPRLSRSRTEAQITRSPKVMSVPVRFVSSERRVSDAAVKIQKAFRGFAVRKSVRKIAAVRREVDEVERTLSRPETAERLRSDGKERLRLSETLMSLLLRLDSVRGVDSGVRDCRKAGIRKAIALQERIDSIAYSSSSSAAAGENAGSAAVSDLDDRDESESRESKTDSAPVETNDEKEEEAAVPEAEPIPDSTDLQTDRTEAEAQMEIAKAEELNRTEAEAPKSDSGSDSDSESSSMEIGKAEEERGEAKGVNGRRSSGELMERMLEDNEKLMGLMTELYERSAAQTRLLSSLSQRVELLERAFLCGKLRKKKKQRRGCDSNNNNNNKSNCGSRYSQL